MTSYSPRLTTTGPELGYGGAVLVEVNCPLHQVDQWSKDLEGLAQVANATSFGEISPPRDTLAVAVWSDSGGLAEGLTSFPKIDSLVQPSTRVLGILIDEAKSTALNPGVTSRCGGLLWLRAISDMVVVSSDSGVVAELVRTMALAAL